jgi:hypothetical protein
MPFLNPGAHSPTSFELGALEITPYSGLSGSAAPKAGVKPASRRGLFDNCANPQCASSWLRLWRRRSVPVFEDGWTCSPECTDARIRSAVVRELAGMEAAGAVHHHRIPLGLLLLEKGWITDVQLRHALDSQRKAGRGRIGEWLVRQGAVNEWTVARGLALQWSCPILSSDGYDAASMATALPRLFLDAFDALPLRISAGKTLYIGFEESLDPVLALAVERMTGLRVEEGIVPEAHFRKAHAQMLEARFPAIELVESVSAVAAAHALGRSVERACPFASRLVRVHRCLWLRMWRKTQGGHSSDCDSVRDVVCLIGGSTVSRATGESMLTLSNEFADRESKLGVCNV